VPARTPNSATASGLTTAWQRRGTHVPDELRAGRIVLGVKPVSRNRDPGRGLLPPEPDSSLRRRSERHTLSDGAVTRHRAPQRPVTPLSDLSEALTGQLAIVRRSGAIVALSTGLVTSVSVPAQALAATASAPIGAPVLAVNAAIAAPSTATVTFETGAFKAVPALVQQPSVRSGGTVGIAPAPAVALGSAAPGSSVLAVAARYVGVPYLYGGTSPRGFDCSGFTGYVYRQLGFSLPRTANEQMLATRRISRSEAQPGDLVFFVSGGRAYHNGIYAGNGMMYDAPRTGKTLQKREIWSADIVFARVAG